MPESVSLNPAHSRAPRLGFQISRWRFLDALFLCLTIGAIKRTFHDAQLNDEDFHVYWKAASEWLAGRNPYAYSAADQGFVFKYPPWILPLFIPIGLLTFENARIAWYVVESLCLAYAVRWSIKQGARPRLAMFTAFLFWWMIHGHFSAGQFTIVLLAVALWTDPSRKTSEVVSTSPPGFFSGLREAFLTYILSAKVFSLYTLAGIWRHFRTPRPWLWGLGLFITTHAVVVAFTPCPNGVIAALIGIYRDFAAAAASGGAELGAIIVRGQGNHGFTALLLRTLGIDSLSFASDMVASAGLFALLGTIWSRASKSLTDGERWAGWIAAGLIVHPLAWHHSFVLAYPLCALSISRAVQTGSRKLIAWAVLGTCGIGIFIPQVLGKTLVKPYELAGGKSWGVVIAAWTLVRAARFLKDRSASTIAMNQEETPS